MLLVLVLLSCILIATPLVSAVAANRGQTKQKYVDYKFEAVLTDAVVTVVVTPPSPTTPPKIVIEGYRPASGVQSCMVTINGETYYYPEDFSYSENFRIEGNPATGVGVIEVKTELTFNLPGCPTVTDWLSGQVTGIGTGSLNCDCAFYLTGTKMFNKVAGGGIVESTTIAYVDYALHIGQIIGWPFGE